MTRVVYKNKDLAIYNVNDRTKEIRSHYYLHEKWCGGRQVALLPFRFGKRNRPEYLLRKEMVPAWRTDMTCMAAISGVIADYDTSTSSAAGHLWKNTGFQILYGRRFKFLGSCRGSKRVDTVYDLYAVNVHGLTQEPPEGNGTPLDDMATLHWVVNSTIGMAIDPLVYVLHYRTARYIGRLARPRATGETLKALAGIHA